MQPPFDPGPLADVTYAADGDRWTLVFVRDLAHPPERVWSALTEPDQLAAWSPFTAGRNLAGVGPATLAMVDGDTAVEQEARVFRADAPDVLEYSWGGDLLRWELVATPGGTRLILRHTLEDRAWVPKVAAGWHLCLAVAERLLDGHPIPPIRGAGAVNYGWEELRQAYAKELSIDD